MEIGPFPVPVVTAPTITAQGVSQALTQVQALSAAPLTQRPVDPTGKQEKLRDTKSNKDRRKGDNLMEPADSESPRGHIVNTSA